MAGKIRRKKKSEEDGDSGDGLKKKKSKKNIVEIDGQLYMLDENGNPGKKIRKKKKPGEEEDENGGDKKRIPRRFKSDSGVDARRNARLASGGGGRGGQDDDDEEGGRGRGREGRSNIQAGQRIRRRAKSVGRDKAEQEPTPRMAMSAPGKARTYIDTKGRKVIIDEGGRKTVFDKNGKRLRKKGEKGKSSLLSTPEGAAGGSGDDDFLSSLDRSSHQASRDSSNMFDSLWNDGESQPQNDIGNEANDDGKRTGSGGGFPDSNGLSDNKQQEINSSLSSKISEVGKENKELQLQLSVAEEAIENLTEQNKKEKSKNVKAMTEVMQLKADFTEASSELQKLRSKIKDMQQTLDEKDRELEAASAAAAASHANGIKESSRPCESCKKLKKENEELRETVSADRSTFEKAIDQKDERINFLSIELSTLKEELEAMANGEKGGAKNPTLIRLLKEKKELDTKYNQEKEVTSIRIEGMQEMIESLEKVNLDLKKQLTSGDTGGGLAGGGGHDSSSFDGDRSIEITYPMAAPTTGAGGTKQRAGDRPGARRKSAAAADLNASISDMFSGLMSRK